jgi:hypothetical protein
MVTDPFRSCPGCGLIGSCRNRWDTMHAISHNAVRNARTPANTAAVSLRLKTRRGVLRLLPRLPRVLMSQLSKYSETKAPACGNASREYLLS